MTLLLWSFLHQICSVFFNCKFWWRSLCSNVFFVCGLPIFQMSQKRIPLKTNVKRYFLFNYTAAFIFFGKWKQGENTCRTSWYCFPLKYFLPFSYLDFYLMRKRRLKRQHQRFLSYNTIEGFFTIDVHYIWFSRLFI